MAHESINIRLTPEIYAGLKNLAHETGVSMTAIINKLLEEKLNKEVSNEN